MAGKRIAGPESAGASEQPGRQPPASAAEQAAQAAATASAPYGPLAVQRLTKAEDGRALIVYSRRADSQR